MLLPVNLQKKAEVSTYSSPALSTILKFCRKKGKHQGNVFSFLRQIFKIVFYFFESVVYLKTIYHKSIKIADSKKQKCDDNKKRYSIVSFLPPSQRPSPSLSNIFQRPIIGKKLAFFFFFFTLSAIKKLKICKAFLVGTLIHYHMKSRQHKN